VNVCAPSSRRILPRGLSRPFLLLISVALLSSLVLAACEEEPGELSQLEEEVESSLPPELVDVISTVVSSLATTPTSTPPAATATAMPTSTSAPTATATAAAEATASNSAGVASGCDSDTDPKSKGLCLLRAEEFEEAILELTRAIDSTSDKEELSTLYEYRAKAFGALGDKVRAAADLLLAIATTNDLSRRATLQQLALTALQ
jgi:tetratricopeptide (TPR) repeat protein